MANGFSFPKNEAEFNAWLSNFAYKITEYTNILGIDDAAVIFVTDAVVMTDYLITTDRILKANSKEWKKLINQIAWGNPKTTSKYPNHPDLGTPPTIPAEAAKPYIAKLVQIIKAHPNYTKYIGQDLDIV